MIQILNSIWKFIKKSWEYIALFFSVVFGYLLMSDFGKDKIQEAKDKAQKLREEDSYLQGNEEVIEDQKDSLETNLDDLKKEQKELENELNQKPEKGGNEKPIKEWLDDRYGNK